MVAKEPQDPASVIAEQETTIKRLKGRLEAWADTLSDHRHSLSGEEFEIAIEDMRSEADEL